MLTTISIGVIITIFASAIIWAYGWKDIKKKKKRILKKLLT